LAPGDGLFLFTDGVTESVDRTDQPFGETRLARSLSRTRLGATALIDSVLADVESFVGGMEPFDDITCVAVRLL
jgi:sigma-B regulation protein RsbU (phosphoserine phosphatase)